MYTGHVCRLKKLQNEVEHNIALPEELQFQISISKVSSRNFFHESGFESLSNGDLNSDMFR